MFWGGRVGGDGRLLSGWEGGRRRLLILPLVWLCSTSWTRGFGIFIWIRLLSLGCSWMLHHPGCGWVNVNLPSILGWEGGWRLVSWCEGGSRRFLILPLVWLWWEGWNLPQINVYPSIIILPCGLSIIRSFVISGRICR